jgi:hypothetical protein
VSADVAEAAQRLRERGTISVEKFGLAVKAACKAAGIPPFTPGRFRHSAAVRTRTGVGARAIRVLGLSAVT